ncbi:DUF2235 domain-containing protein [Nocardioides marmoraquaticus]
MTLVVARLSSFPGGVDRAARALSHGGSRGDARLVKRLVVCCDGTWNAAGEGQATNVQRLCARVASRGPDGTEQRSHYLAGVGTKRAERIVGGLTGAGLSRNVRAAYAWLVESFEPGDEIYAVGFSRGAFTARSLVGLVRKAGVLRRDEARRVDEAYALYRRDDVRPADAEPTAFRAAHAHETRVRCVGVWDTVGALGVPTTVPLLSRLNQRYQFHDTELSSWVDNAFHAVAIDERRGSFVPTLWSRRDDAPASQRVEQVWFSGAHSDVGGGYADRDLADLALWWMASRLASCGLALTVPPGPPDPAWTRGRVHDSRSSLFRFLRAVDREIGAVDRRTESVTRYAAERGRSFPDYAPPQLRRYLDAGGTVLDL